MRMPLICTSALSKKSYTSIKKEINTIFSEFSKEVSDAL